MRRLVIILAAGAAMAALPTQGHAQVQVGPYLAFHDDMDLGIGAFVGIPFPALEENISFVGDLGVFFPDDAGSNRDRDYFEINANLLYRFPLVGQDFYPWVLGGINIGRYSSGRDDDDPGRSTRSDTEMGLNVGGGVTFGSGNTRPFAGVKFELGGFEGGVLFGGVSFLVGEGN